MFDYNGSFKFAIAALKRERRYRVFADLERKVGQFPHALWNSPSGKRDVVVWCSNDYLGMGQHPKVIEAMCSAARTMGAGAGGTRNISGTNRALVELEAELADLHGKQAALVFTSGYVSNHTGIATIARLLPDCLILSDALNHNSIVEGVRAAGCAKQIWRHNDTQHLEELLSRAAPGRPKLNLVIWLDGSARTIVPMFGEQRLVRCQLKPQRWMAGRDHVVVHVLICRANVTAGALPSSHQEVLCIDHP